MALAISRGRSAAASPPPSPPPAASSPPPSASPAPPPAITPPLRCLRTCARDNRSPRSAPSPKPRTSSAVAARRHSFPRASLGRHRSAERASDTVTVAVGNGALATGLNATAVGSFHAATGIGATRPRAGGCHQPRRGCARRSLHRNGRQCDRRRERSVAAFARSTAIGAEPPPPPSTRSLAVAPAARSGSATSPPRPPRRMRPASAWPRSTPAARSAATRPCLGRCDPAVGQATQATAITALQSRQRDPVRHYRPQSLRHPRGQ